MNKKLFNLITVFMLVFSQQAFSQVSETTVCDEILYKSVRAEAVTEIASRNILINGKVALDSYVQNDEDMFSWVLTSYINHNPSTRSGRVWFNMPDEKTKPDRITELQVNQPILTASSEDNTKFYSSIGRDNVADGKYNIWNDENYQPEDNLEKAIYNAMVRANGVYGFIKVDPSSFNKEDILKAIPASVDKIKACVEAKTKIRRDIDLRTGSINPGQYTGQTKDDLDAAIKAADAVVANPNATMAELEKALADLNLAKDKADKEKTTEDVNALIVSMKDDLKNYEGEDKKNLEQAIKDAEDIAKNPDATTEELEKVLNDLDVAKDEAFETRIKENRPDDIVKLKSSLNALIAAMEADLGNYEGQAKADLQDLINAAKNIANNPAVSSEELVDTIVAVNGIWYQIPRKSSNDDKNSKKIGKDGEVLQPGAKITIFGKEYNNLGTDRDAFVGNRSKASINNTNTKDMEKIDIFGKKYNNYKGDRDGFVGNRGGENKQDETNQNKSNNEVVLSAEQTDFFNIIEFTVSNSMKSFTDEGVEDQIYKKLELAAEYVKTGKVVISNDQIKYIMISLLLQDLSKTEADRQAVTESFDSLDEDEMQDETFTLIVDQALEGKPEQLKIMTARTFYEVLIESIEEKEGI